MFNLIGIIILALFLVIAFIGISFMLLIFGGFTIWWIVTLIREQFHDLSTWWHEWHSEMKERKRTVYREVFMDRYLTNRKWAEELKLIAKRR